jgi:hypothetical protein
MTTSTTLTRRARIRRSEDEWRELFARFEHGGQSREQFCADRGLAVSTFSRWRQRMRPLGRADAKLSSEAVFVELSSTDAPDAVASPWDVELQLGKGMFLRFRQSPC